MLGFSSVAETPIVAMRRGQTYAAGIPSAALIQMLLRMESKRRMQEKTKSQLFQEQTRVIQKRELLEQLETQAEWYHQQKVSEVAAYTVLLTEL